MDILRLMDELLAKFFRTGFFARLFDRPDSWRAWRVFLAVLFGLNDRIDAEGLALYRECTGRQALPTEPITQAWLNCGRRAGKSLIAALVAVYLAFFRDYVPFLAPGEVATVMVIAADRKQARVIMRFVRGFIKAVPMFALKVIAERQDAIELSNRVVIEIHTASFRSTRGYTLAAAICDELAAWRTDESAAPDREIIAALQPALATIPGAMMVGLSSPRARCGVLWAAHQQNFGKENAPALYWKAPSLVMNPSLSKKIVEAAYEADPANAGAEYGAEFRSDLETIFSRDVLAVATVHGRYELPRASGVVYSAFVDPSGGSSDSITLAVAHQGRDGRTVLDCLRERKPPFSPDDVVEEFAGTLKSYGVTRVTGDRYAGEWPRERFRAHGIQYEPSAKSKSELYLEFLPLLNAGRVELLDNNKLITQLVSLERRVARGGKDSVDHPPSSHDDIANAAAGALVFAPRGDRKPWAEVIDSGLSRQPFRGMTERGWTKIA